MGRKSKAPKLDTGSGSSPYLSVHPGSGVVSFTGAHTSSAAAPPLPANALTGMPPERVPKNKKKAGEADTAGASWGHMRAPTVTPELKRELLIVKMRDVLDPKRFYRSADGKELPKYFQMGTIVEGAEDGAHRLTKRERKGSMLQELMSDGAIRKRAKSQFLKSQAAHAEGRQRRFKPKRGKDAGRKRR